MQITCQSNEEEITCQSNEEAQYNNELYMVNMYILASYLLNV